MAQSPTSKGNTAKLLPECWNAPGAAETTPTASSPVEVSSQPQGPTTGPGSQESEFGKMLARITAQGDQRISDELAKELALEIVLNGIAERACLATGATGSAIALRNGDEMVCRASRGGAPGLGTRLNTNIGLSGACARNGHVERCDDAWNDPRTDAELARQLEVRSVLVHPVMRGSEILGILEIFSPLPSAFGDHDLDVLDALAKQTVNDIQARENWTGSKASIPQPIEAPEESADSSTQPTSTDLVIDQDLSIPDLESVTDNSSRRTWDTLAASAANFGRVPSRGLDWFTGIIAAIVFSIAILMIVVLSVRLGWIDIGRHRNSVRAAVSSIPPAPTEKQVTASDAVAKPTPLSALEKKPGGSQAVPDHHGALVNEGSLQVFENGKEIFRMTSPDSDANKMGREDSAGTGTIAKLSQDMMQSELLQRVEPQYPAEALLQRVQGPVVLRVHIRRDGTVQQIEVLSGNALLSPAAVTAVQQWKFKPHLVDGRPVETQSEITLKFLLPPN